MSKMSNLDLVLDEMVTAGQKMIETATALREMFSETAAEYYVAAEPPVRCGESHPSGQTEPPCY